MDVNAGRDNGIERRINAEENDSSEEFYASFGQKKYQHKCLGAGMSRKRTLTILETKD